MVYDEPHGAPTRELFDTQVSVQRAAGPVRELQAERLPLEAAGREWEWEQTPEVTLIVVDDVAREGDLTRVVARIIVERDSQKGILIGARGAMMKEIGSAARRGLESLLGTRVYLDLQVTVFPGWQRDPKGLQRLGF